MSSSDEMERNDNPIRLGLELTGNIVMEIAP